jgi:adenosine kinase
MPWVLVCGSIALDFVGRYDGSFASYQDKYDVQALNISLQLTDLRSSFGGCGMNITYGLHCLGVPVMPLSAAGANFTDHYQPHLSELGINTDYIAVDPDLPRCATALLISDDHGNQITGFHAGASVSALRKLPREIATIDDCRIAILAPEDAPIMLRQARDLASLEIPIIFDPGQGISGFAADEILELLQLSDTVIINYHEYEILQHNAGLDSQQIEAMMRCVIVTRSNKGVDIIESGERFHIDAVKDVEIVDPTGCGDAFRAGYLFGLMNDYSTDISARFGCLLAAINLENVDTQTYFVDPSFLLDRYQAAYGEINR